mgnify:CR=1 FL=1
MKTIITDHYIPALLNLFVNNIDRTPQWQANTRYIEGTTVRNNARQYLAASTGTSGQNGPLHSSGKGADGGISWYFVRDTASADSLGGNLFLGVGNPGEWKDEPTADDIDETTVEMTCLESLITAFRLTSGDIVLGIPRRPWVEGLIEEWPNVNSYVTVDQSVYRCLSNNAGVDSTVTPAGTSLTPFELSDGYVWKYLGSVSISQYQKFATTEAFPITSLNVDDGSDRWMVQSVAKSGSISTFSNVLQIGTFTTPVVNVFGTGSGSTGRADLTIGGDVRRVIATSGGTGYTQGENAIAIVKESGATNTTDATATATIDTGVIDAVTVVSQGTGYTDAVAFIHGDGQGAVVEVETMSGFVTTITVVDGGTGYTRAEVVIIPGTAGAIAEAVMAPVGGHGRSMTKELPVEFAIVNKRVNSYEGGFIPEGDIRQFSLITGVTTATPGDILIGQENTENSVTAILDGARVLCVKNIDTVTHETEQYEEITVALRLSK